MVLILGVVADVVQTQKWVKTLPFLMLLLLRVTSGVSKLAICEGKLLWLLPSFDHALIRVVLFL